MELASDEAMNRVNQPNSINQKGKLPTSINSMFNPFHSTDSFTPTGTHTHTHLESHTHTHTS